MEFGRLGVWTWLDSMPATDAAAFTARIAALGYGTLWLAQGGGGAPFALAARVARGGGAPPLPPAPRARGPQGGDGFLPRHRERPRARRKDAAPHPADAG